jgi:hypothetical protein
MALKKGDWFPATFQPKDRAAVSPAGKEWIGWTGLWEAFRFIEEGPNAGQFACVVHRKHRETGHHGPPPEAFLSVPESDLVPVEISPEVLAEVETMASELLEEKIASGEVKQVE